MKVAATENREHARCARMGYPQADWVIESPGHWGIEETYRGSRGLRGLLGWENDGPGRDKARGGGTTN